MGKKGVSADEKRARLLTMFHTSRAVYTKKEVERDGAKLGILSQAVEGVLKDLCGDDLVKEAKVGISTYYWAFPGELGTSKTRALNLANERLARARDDVARLEALEAEQDAACAGVSADEAAQASKLEASIAKMQAEEKGVSDQLRRLVDESALDLRARKKDISVLKDAANRWTDNLFETRKHLVNLGTVDGPTFDKQFGLEGLDFLE